MLICLLRPHGLGRTENGVLIAHKMTESPLDVVALKKVKCGHERLQARYFQK